jgi:hypothetical protein
MEFRKTVSGPNDGSGKDALSIVWVPKVAPSAVKIELGVGSFPEVPPAAVNTGPEVAGMHALSSSAVEMGSRFTGESTIAVDALISPPEYKESLSHIIAIL